MTRIDNKLIRMYVKVRCFSRFYQINASVINCYYLPNIAWVCLLMLNLTPWFTQNIIICIIIYTSHPLITWWTNTRLVLVAVVIVGGPDIERVGGLGNLICMFEEKE